jgi:hypothetical protein
MSVFNSFMSGFFEGVADTAKAAGLLLGVCVTAKKLAK